MDDWPPNSTDLNSIKDYCLGLKYTLQRIYPDIQNTQGGLDKVIARLAKVLPKIYQETPEPYFEIQ